MENCMQPNFKNAHAGLVSFNQSTYVSIESEGLIMSVLILNRELDVDTNVQLTTRAITVSGKLI